VPRDVFLRTGGEIIVLQVAGDVDLLTLAVLQAALTDGLARRSPGSAFGRLR
jgi:hypothetical protein